MYGDSVLMQYADQLLVTGNHAGVPGMSVPAGFNAAGLPVGIHFFAPDYREEILFRAGYAYEQATAAEAWRAKKPAL